MSADTPDLEKLRYPIGRFDPAAAIAPGQRRMLIDSIAAVPARVRAAIAGLDDAGLDTPYRDGGWTIRQLVHHVPDSHLNAYVRFKWTLTESEPVIKTYDEAAWARLPDSSVTPIDVSLLLLESVHARWDVLLRSMSDEDFAKKLNHPEWGPFELNTMVRMYEWHGRHHVAHITGLRARSGI
jgi:DinB superfamily